VNAATATTRNGTMPGDLWQRYRQAGDPDARRQLLELYIGLVHHVAREMSRRTKAVELDDLVSAGTFGLIRALDSFDLSRGLAFSTYAVRRIRGAILDDLRSQDWAPRAVRVKARRLQVATTALEYRLGRTPQPEEVAAQLDIDVSTYWRWRDDTASRTVVSYEGESVSRAGGATTLQELLQDPEATTAAEDLGRREEIMILRDTIGRLPEKERTVMALYYYEELNQRQIAEIMHVTESRVSQIRTQALKRLRSRLVPSGDLS
jgi:RNA polymerase sigma factor FliA